MVKINTQETGTETKGEDATAAAPRPTLPKHLRVANNVRKSCGRFVKLTEYVEALGPEAEDAVLSMKGAIDAIGEAIRDIEGLPEDFKPPRKTRTGAAPLEVGATVQLRSGKRAEFAELLSTEEMDSLEVTALNGRRVICVTEAGVKLFLPRSALKSA